MTTKLDRWGALCGRASLGLVVWACSSPTHELLSGDEVEGNGGGGADPQVGNGGDCFVGVGGSGAAPSMAVEELIEPGRRPPPLSGGTLIASADSRLAIAADPDRDRVYFVDVSSPDHADLLGEVEFPEAAEPGRLVEDAAGRVHVVLRGSGEIASIDVETRQMLGVRAVCDQPRGIAFDPGGDLLHVACAEGLLESLPASGGGARRVLNLGQDLRDVIVRGDELYVSRFRSAELLRVSADNEVTLTMKPGELAGPEVHPCAPPTETGAAAPPARRHFEPRAAWRTIALGTYEALMVHQREESTSLEIDETADQGYNSGAGDCLGVVQSVVSVMSAYGDDVAFPTLPGAVLPVDVALSADQERFAVVAAGSTGIVAGNVFFQSVDSYASAGRHDQQVSSNAEACPVDMNTRWVPGQPTSVAFLGHDRAMVLTRQPAALFVLDAAPVGEMVSVALSDIDLSDTGHMLFHSDVGGGIACASCHPEAGDDGHVWSFEGIGPRRTQNLRGGILGTEPFHWEGDLEHFGSLVNEVLVRRMNGPTLEPEYIDSLAHWIDAQPAFRRTRFDEQAAARGEALFHSVATGCSTCHAGTRFTNSLTVDVGTGLALQVPSLLGVSFRGPYMHDGCAPTLQARFGNCGGGDLHGKTSQLTDTEITDLVEYMKTL